MRELNARIAILELRVEQLVQLLRTRPDGRRAVLLRGELWSALQDLIALKSCREELESVLQERAAA